MRGRDKDDIWGASCCWPSLIRRELAPVGGPVAWGKLDDAARRKLIADAMRWPVDNPDMALPPGYAEALERGADDLERLDRTPSDKAPGWLRPGMQGKSADDPTADERVRRALVAGAARRQAATEGRKWIDDVLPAVAAREGVSVSSVRRWEADAKASNNPQIRRAYQHGLEHGAAEWASSAEVEKHI